MIDRRPVPRCLMPLLATLWIASCGGETSGAADAGHPHADAGSRFLPVPSVEAKDPCLTVGYLFDGKADCDVVRCPELTCRCMPSADAGVTEETRDFTFGACVPSAGCLEVVDCDRICDRKLELVREACDLRVAAATSERCEDEADCGGECREESVGALCVDQFRCAESGHCAMGSRCLFDPDTLVEDNQQPTALGHCSDGSAGSHCFDDGHCQAGRCIQGWCTSGLEGEACTESHHCASGFCRNWASSIEGVCVSGQQGGACSDDGDCDQGLHCTADVCHSDAVGQRCEMDSQCASEICVSGRCQSGDLGAHCDDHDDCPNGYCVSRRCASGGLLAPCSEDTDCHTSLACVRQRCSDGSQGMPCTTVDDCSVLACVHNACSEGADGAVCLTNEQCTSDRCANPAGAQPGECTSGEAGSICVSGTNCLSGSCTWGFCN